jgi:hypothetical protein
MTAEEHKLLVLMFGMQAQRINILLEILRAKGIAEEDDFKAFEFASRSDVPANAELAQEVSELWIDLCQKAGVPLPPLPQTPPTKN